MIVSSSKKWSGVGWLCLAASMAVACGGSGDTLFDGAAASAGSPNSGGSAGAPGSGGASWGGSANDASAGSSGIAGASGKAGSANGGASGNGGSITGGAAGSAGTAGAAATGGAGGCGSCDDTVACTVDSCKNNKCSHDPDSKLCPENFACDPLTGCIPSLACSATSDCVQKLGSDACKSNIKCDPAKSICTWESLDKDKDGSPPVVCGGTDCDDSDGSIHVGLTELCDGKDNDCNGQIDDTASCPGLQLCTAGSCTCPANHQCGAACVDKQTDPANCGTCGNSCPSAASCQSGQCVCNASATLCSGACVDTKTDPHHCGACNAACGVSQTCSSSQCMCPGNVLACNGLCPNYATDANNCGSCGNTCAGAKTCQSGSCLCPSGLTDCNGGCVDTKLDPSHCGNCNTVCGATATCVNSVCKVCPTTDLIVLIDESGSTSTTLSTGISRLQAMIGATKAFIAEPASLGIGVGLQYFPIPPPPKSCVSAADCTAIDPNATCTNLMCAWYDDSCNPADYAKPAVPAALLSSSGQLTALNQSLDVQVFTNATPMVVALQGVLQYGLARAQNTGHRVAVVMLTDGLPNYCGNPTTLDAANAVQPYSSSTPKIATYVIGVGTVGAGDWTPTDWNQIASAGGTNQFYPGTTQVEIQTALDTIRTSLSACQ